MIEEPYMDTIPQGWSPAGLETTEGSITKFFLAKIEIRREGGLLVKNIFEGK